MSISFEMNVDKLIQDIEVNYVNDLNTKIQTLLTRLGELGYKNARDNFEHSIYDGNKGNSAFYYQVDDDGVTITAYGEKIAFIEFGTGVTYGYGYKGERPDGIVDIGEYGHKRGRNPKGWYYYGEGGQPAKSNKVSANAKAKGLKHTYGNQPNMFMYYSLLAIQLELEQVAREVLGNDRQE